MANETPEREVTRRGINLGCGTVIMPCERPAHHFLLPQELYTAQDIAWDNVDRNPAPGVDMIVNLFDYPWRTADGVLPDNTYDVAIAAHIVEHIPHMVVRYGQLVPFDNEYQDGWFAWFAELWRILKPGGVAYILAPYAWSNAGISDPTHTRYCTFATFGYFNGDSSTFHYQIGSLWNIDFNTFVWSPHAQARDIVDHRIEQLAEIVLDPMQELWRLSQSNINMLVDFMVPMRAVK